MLAESLSEPMSESVDIMPQSGKKILGFAIPRLNRHEISGSLGDLGTFIPLLVGMSITNGLDFTSALFFAGLFNIVT